MAEADVDEEFVAIDGIVAYGEHGVAVAPTDATSELDPSWTDLGLTTDTGVTRSETSTSTVRRAWQKRVKLRTLVTDAAVRWQFILLQTNRDSVELFSGIAVADDGSVIVDPSREKPLIRFCRDDIDGDDVVREYAPRARVVEVGDQVSVGTDSYGWPVTVEAEYDTDLGGYTQRWFSALETPEGS